MSEPTGAEIRALYATALATCTEQREQLNAMQRYEETHLGNLDDLREQIVALTAEYGAVLLKLDACRGEAAKERHTLTAENEALKADLKTNAAMLARQCDLARQAEAERDEARAKLAILIGQSST